MVDINIAICEFITKEWIGNSTNRSFAIKHDVDEKTVRQIKNIQKTYYSITVPTLEKICLARDVKLEEFFRLIKR